MTAAGVSGSPKTIPVTFTIAAPSTGLVGAWGFDETTGGTTADASGKGNTGTLSGAVRTTAGRFGGALEFDGVNDWVTVNDSTSLRLTTGMTIEGWAYPTPAATGARSRSRRPPAISRGRCTRSARTGVPAGTPTPAATCGPAGPRRPR